MNFSRINFGPVIDGGDNVTGAFRKVDLNFNVLSQALADDGFIGGRFLALEHVAQGLGTAADRDVGTSAGTVAAGDDGRFASSASAAASAQATANDALPRKGGEITGAISAKLGGVVAFGTTGSANIGGLVYSDYFQSTVADIGSNIFMRLQCVDVLGGPTYSRLLTSHFDGTNASFIFRHDGIAQATTWQSTSDERLKRNLVVLSDPLDKIESIVGYEFYEKRILGNTEDAEGRRLPAQYTATCGVLAQDVGKVLPAAVDNLGAGMDTNDRPIEDVLGVNDAGLSALFVECIKALKLQNASLENRIRTLEAELAIR